MNLTYSQVLTGLKYLNAPSDSQNGEAAKKAGFFSLSGTASNKRATAWALADLADFP